jgi:hypothetical protein
MVNPGRMEEGFLTVLKREKGRKAVKDAGKVGKQMGYV